MNNIFDSKFDQGHFMPKWPDRCLNYNGKIEGAKPIYFRSSWEKRLCKWCDDNANVLEWGVEVLEIPYYSEIDHKRHRYIVDFVMACKTRDGGIKKYVCEVKPASQVARLDEHGDLIMPKPPKKQTQKKLESWQQRCNVIRRNNEKWTAARRYCKENGCIFRVITEAELQIIR